MDAQKKILDLIKEIEQHNIRVWVDRRRHDNDNDKHSK